MTDAPAPVVKPLDLSNLLKHAFMAGREASAPAGQSLDAWVNYDPNECAAYARILSALTVSAPVEAMVEALSWIATYANASSEQDPEEPREEAECVAAFKVIEGKARAVLAAHDRGKG